MTLAQYAAGIVIAITRKSPDRCFGPAGTSLRSRAAYHRQPRSSATSGNSTADGMLAEKES